MKRYAVITGATQGIGLAIAERFLSEGCSVAVCARSQDDLDALAARWASEYPGSETLVLRADLSDAGAVRGFAEAVQARFPQVDVLVNNAGAFTPGALLEEAEGNLERLLQLNLMSAYHLTRALAPAMQARGVGHIFNICSVASLQAYPNGGAYSISKYALLGFSDNLRLELSGSGVRVTAVCPGATMSRSWSGAGVPEERLMKSSDIAEAVYSAYRLSGGAVMERMVLRPQLGDL